MDGANVEMAEEMGEENMFIFGLDVEGVDALKAAGYDAKKYYNANPELARIVDQIRGGAFSPGDRKDEFDDLINALMNHDRFLTLADFDAYIACQDRVDQAYEVSQLNTFVITLVNNYISELFPLGQDVNLQHCLVWEIQFRQNYCRICEGNMGSRANLGEASRPSCTR